MKSLIRKELRELLTPALIGLGVALVLVSFQLIAAMRDRDINGAIALYVWIVLAFVFAFLGGGSAIARDSRQGLIFLTSWPLGRLPLWLTKSLLSLLTAAFIILAGMLLTHTTAALIEGPAGLADELRMSSWGILGFALLTCFAFALMWSGVANSTLAAAGLGLATLSTSIAAVVCYVIFCLAVLWGPYLGGWNETDTTTYVLIGLLSAIALISGATAFIRYPLLDTRPRALRALATWLVLLILLLGGITAHQRFFRRPAFDRPVSEVHLVAGGTQLLVKTNSSTKDPGGFWSLPLTTLQPRLLARSDTGGFLYTDQPVALRYGYEFMFTYWAANLDSHHLYRLRGEPIAGSPDGRYFVVEHDRKVVVQNNRGRIVARPPTSTSDILFSPDSRYLYFESTPMRLEALDLHTGQTSLIKQLDVSISLSDLSPDGRTLLAHTMHDKSNKFSGMLALDLTTGRTRTFPDLGPNANCFITDDLVWTRYDKAPQGQAEIRFVNLRTGQTTAAISSTQLENYRPIRLWHQPNLPYCVLEAYDPGEGPGRIGEPLPRRLYVTNPDGTNLRFLRTEPRYILGLTAQGQILLLDREHRADSGNTLTYDRKRTLTTLNPLTNQEQPLLTL